MHNDKASLQKQWILEGHFWNKVDLWGNLQVYLTHIFKEIFNFVSLEVGYSYHIGGLNISILLSSYASWL